MPTRLCTESDDLHEYESSFIDKHRHLSKDSGAFCQSLNSGMQLLSLSDVQLTHGSWVPVLDLLRDLLNERWVQGKCQVRLSLLGGAEIEQLEAAHNNEEGETAYLERLMGRFMEFIQSQQVGKNPATAPGVFS